MPYEYAALKSVIYPEPTTILDALNKSKKIDFANRDQRQLTAILERMEEVNTRLSAHLRVRNTAVAAFDWSLTGGDDNKREAARLRLSDAIDYIIKHWHYLDAYGKIAFSVDWRQEEQLTTWKPFLNFVEMTDLDAYKGVYGVWSEGVKNKIELSENFIAENVNGYLRTMLITECFRYDAQKEQGNFIRKLKGILQLIAKGAAGDEEKAAAKQAAQNVAKNGFVLTDDQIEFKLNQIAAGGGTAFKEAIEQCNADIAIGALGQANTSELPNSGGSRAALKIMKLVSADIHFTDVNRLEKFVNEQLLKWDWLKNFGAAPEWRFKVDVAEGSGFVETAGAVSELIDKIPVVKSELYKLLNLTEPQDGDETIGGLV